MKLGYRIKQRILNKWNTKGWETLTEKFNILSHQGTKNKTSYFLILIFGKFMLEYCIYLVSSFPLFHQPYPMSLLHAPVPSQILDFFFFNYMYMYTHRQRDRYTNINLLSPFCLVHVYMFSGLTSWYWIINVLIPGENSFSIVYQSWIDYSSLSRCGVLWDFTYLCWHANLGSLVKVLLGQP